MRLALLSGPTCPDSVSFTMPAIYREPLCPLKVLPLTARPLWATSESVTSPSSLIPAHAPDQKPSWCLGVTLVHQVFAGCYEPLLGVGPSRRYLCRSFSRCLAPYPGGTFVVHLPVSSHEASAFPPLGQGRLPQHPHSGFSTVLISRLQAFSNVQASTFARHPDRSYQTFVQQR